MSVVQEMAEVRVTAGHAPSQPVVIANCGVVVLAEGTAPNFASHRRVSDCSLFSDEQDEKRLKVQLARSQEEEASAAAAAQKAKAEQAARSTATLVAQAVDGVKSAIAAGMGEAASRKRSHVRCTFSSLCYLRVCSMVAAS